MASLNIFRLFKRRRNRSEFETDAQHKEKQQQLLGGEKVISAPTTADFALSESIDFPGASQKQQLGIVNLGNTCYLNSALQCLLSIPNFCKDLCRPELLMFLKEDEYAKEGDDDSSSKTATKSRVPLYKALLTIAVQLGKIVDKDDLELIREYIDVDPLSSAVNPQILKDAVDEVTSDFVGYRQQDSHEFLTVLIDRLHDELEGVTAQTVTGDDVTSDENDEAVSEKVVEENTSSNAAEAQPPSSPRPSTTRLRSYSGMDVETIGELLHSSHPPATPRLTEAFSTDDLAAMDNVCCVSLPIMMGMEMDISPNGDAVGDGNGSKGSSVDEKDVADESPGGNDETAMQEEAEIQADDEQHNEACTDNDGCDDTSCTTSSELPTICLPTSDHFTTEVDVRLTCNSCSYTRTRTELYRHFSLDVTDKKRSSVDEGLRRFFAPEKIEIKCEKCFADSATQYKEISKLGCAMLLHFKRFVVTVSDTYEVNTKKSLEKVEFGEELDLSYFCCNNVSSSGHGRSSIPSDESQEGEDEVVTNDSMSEDDYTCPQVFKLRSVIHHIGSTASCGHYTADSLVDVVVGKGKSRKKYSRAEQWYKFNDSVAKTIGKKDVFGKRSQETAYLVMYEMAN
eukprot:CAMPEP_0116014254 /NCGR_PEP_ID=MMETSP0321-20121206/6177_1 /TAXON_ID=163516 /ORGANISM="Leptocylindrus danicus var. danicus, Strain B650" /LENGTH=623 /DNA_ID=CAMNT_0003483889 /DNA_START=192 /DNA_END=2063 /DNA_ORIENTATION=+